MRLVPRVLTALAAAGALSAGSLTGVAAVATAAPTRPAASTPTGTAGKTVRLCGEAARGRMACLSLRQVAPAEPSVFRHAAIAPDATPAGFGPASLDSAYKLPTTGGAGQTVAIVDAYNDPNAAADLGVYRSQYGLPACTVASGCFRQLNQNGATSPLPTSDTGWAGEESLDVDMVSAICPNCHIILIEASAPSDADLYAAEDEAVALGAKFVSNSYGGSESSADTTADAHFNHPGVAITASSGDSAYGTEYPAASRYVTAVGGTSLSPAGNARGWTETAWKDAGSGCSTYDPRPTWQTESAGSCSRRAVADVSAVADPNTGVAVYQTYGASGWQVYGGTSVASPVIAGVYALAGAPASGSYPASYPWSHTGNLFDVTTGSNGSCSPAALCTAGAGWDGPTGLGTPDSTTAFTGSTTGALSLANPGSQTGTVGAAPTVTLSASGGTTPYSYSATGLPTGLSVNSSTGAVSGTPTTAGTYSVTATVHDAASHVATAGFSWVISAAGSCTAKQLLANPGFETGSASPWVATAGVVSANGSGESSHSGTYYAWLDGYGTTHTDTLTQAVTIPAGCTKTVLSFWLHVDTAETTTTSPYDELTVTVGSTTEVVYSNLNHNTGYAQHSFNVGSFAGQTVTLKFSGTEDSSLQTSFVIDDTAVTTG